MIEMNNYKISDFYNISNVKIVGNNQENLKEYSEIIKKLLVDDKKITENELVVFNRLMGNLKDNESGKSYSADVEKLLNTAEIYHNALAQLSSLGAPEGLAKKHLLLLNGLNNMNGAVKLMASTPEDSIKGLLGYRIYSQEVVKFSDAFESIKGFLEDKNIFISD